MSLTTGEVNCRPTRRFAPYTVLRGLMSSCPLAGWPTMIFPFSLMATIEGMVLWPSREGITSGFPSFTTAEQELVVPRSIPIIGPFFSARGSAEGGAAGETAPGTGVAMASGGGGGGCEATGGLGGGCEATGGGFEGRGCAGGGFDGAGLSSGGGGLMPGNEVMGGG